MISAHRPVLEMLSREMIEKIIGEALDILEKVGVFVENEESLKLLKEAGMKMKGGRVFITEKLVRDALETPPSSIKIYDRSGNLKMVLEGNNVYFVPGSTAVYFLDSEGKMRKPVTQDYISYARLVDYLHYLDGQSTAMIPSDIPKEIADRYRLYLSLLHCTKPIVTGTFVKEGFEPMKEMLVAVRGSEENLRGKPLTIFDACPSPPSKWSDLTCQSLIDCAHAGIPAELVSMPLAGATAPVTLSGALVQHTAESLSGVVINQLAGPGSPIIYGGSPAIFDMKCGTTPMGAIETMMINVAYAQIGKYLGLPTHAYMGLSDSKTLDFQMGLEAGVSVIMAALAGINVISGPGMLGFENCQSLEKLVIDNEICGMAFRLIEGISQRAEPMAEEIIEECIEKGDFLTHLTTLQWFKKEQFMPGPIIDRMSIASYEEQKEKKAAMERAKEEVKTMLESHSPSLLDEDVERALKKIMERETKGIARTTTMGGFPAYLEA